MVKALAHLVDEDTFVHVDDELSARDPLSFPGYREALQEGRGESDEAVVAGPALIGGHACIVAAFDFTFMGGSMGEVAGERLARAMERAVDEGIPFVMRTETGGARIQEGMRALVQMPKVVAARLALADAHRPFIAVLGNPTTGGVLASIAALADITIAEEGATIGFAGPRLVQSFTGRPVAGSHTAQTALNAGLVDASVPSEQVGNTVAHALDILRPAVGARGALDHHGSQEARAAWDVVLAARRERRPSAPRILDAVLQPHAVLRGDRAGRDDPALVCALGRWGERPVLCMALDREVRPGPSAYRKATRCVRIASRLRLPIITLIDTPGANPSETSENAGIAWAISELMAELLSAPGPVIAVVTGEGGSGGALALATADVVLAYADSFFSVIAPESAAEIMWRDATRAAEAARTLKLTAPDLLDLGIADGLIAAPIDDTSHLKEQVAYHLAGLDEGGGLTDRRRARWRNA